MVPCKAAVATAHAQGRFLCQELLLRVACHSEQGRPRGPRGEPQAQERARRHATQQEAGAPREQRAEA